MYPRSNKMLEEMKHVCLKNKNKRISYAVFLKNIINND